MSHHPPQDVRAFPQAFRASSKAFRAQSRNLGQMPDQIPILPGIPPGLPSPVEHSKTTPHHFLFFYHAVKSKT